MATSKATKDLIEDLHERGLRKKVAKSVAEAIGSGSHKTAPPAVAQVMEDLKGMADEIEDRATGRSAKRRAAGRKAAATRARKADARSAAARKGARSRTASSTSR
ncbi:MAG: hypothetical protein JHC74_06695 [Thermoleophilia bacterium]|nr:hypothetical protein [Thermoleophilia bacterium]